MRFGLVVTLLSTMMYSAVQSSEAGNHRISLDGEWLFRADPAGLGISQQWYLQNETSAGWKKTNLPGFWETLSGLEKYDGDVWFIKRFRIDSITGPMSVHFAGVDDDATVWFNGSEVGKHTGYSEPFAIDIASSVRPGWNTIVVKVKDHAGPGGIYKPVTLIHTADLEELLKGPLFGTPARASADWVRDAVVYEVYLRSFSPEGTFEGLGKRIHELKELGVTVLWLMPIHPVGKIKRKGSLGSPYAISDYYAVNPEFGTMDDFDRLLHAVHGSGMKLIIDLVANHTAWDSKLITEHPEWFTRDAGGAIVPPNEDWTDVADLDFSQRGLREYMIEMMTWWVRDVGIDGFRCDVAELVPTDFWEEARDSLDRIKSVMMLSEGTLPEHHVKAFDMTYSWNLYDKLESLVRGEVPVQEIDKMLGYENLQFPEASLRLRFSTNHDKNAWDSPASTKFGDGGNKLAALLAVTLPGVPLIYNGEEVGNKKRLDLFEKVPIDWGGR